MKHLNNYTIFLESYQKFDFEENKKSILSFIKEVKNGKWPAYSCFYLLITGSHRVGVANEIGFSDEDKSKWKKYFKSSIFYSDGLWSQVSLNKNLPRKTGKDKTLNYYITVDKTKSNIVNFGRSLNDLIQQLSKLSDETKSPISFKTHTLLDVFVTHNDSLKVYYYDPDLKDEIERVVKEWISRNNIKVSERTHYHGVDIRKDGGKKQSWGEILSNIVESDFVATIKKYGNTYTDEYYYEWLKRYMPTLIKSVVKSGRVEI